jgi:conserved oligomeric Golgi complex subunit 5
LDLARHTLRTFLLHISIVKPLGESGKLQLTTDMTELEFALSTLLAEGVAQGNTKQRWKLDVLGVDYRAMRAMRSANFLSKHIITNKRCRHLLFLSDESLANPEQTAGLPPLIILHHILVRSPLPLPHKLHGWQESQYVRFVEEHTDEEVWSVLEQGLKHWRTSTLSEIEDAEDAGSAGAAKRREKEEELRTGQQFVQLATTLLEHARGGVL